MNAGFRIRDANWSADASRIELVRRNVFVIEQQIPEELEWDDDDKSCLHALAEDVAGQPVGTGRLLEVLASKVEQAIGVDQSREMLALARANLAWLIANLALGVVVLVLGLAWSKRYVERPDLGPRARRLVDAVSGRALRSVAGHLAELSRFERDEPPA